MRFDEAVYQVLQQRKYDRLMDRAFDIHRLLSRLFERAVAWLVEHLRLRPPGQAEYDTALFAALFVIIAVAVVTAAVVAVRLAMKRTKAIVEAEGGLFDETRSQNVSYDKLKALGASHAERGDLRAAVRYEYAALLWLLNDENIARPGQAKTNSQLAREVSKNAPGISERFNRAVHTFQCAWFGHKPVSQSAFDDYAAGMEALAREVRK